MSEYQQYQQQEYQQQQQQQQQYQQQEEQEEEQQSGGRSKSKKVVKKYEKTDKENKDRCGVIRRIYERNGVMYIRKKSKKTGKIGYNKVKSVYTR
jgi:hypothetical protein